MKRERVNITDFNRIAKENEYFLWHFLQKEQEESQSMFYSIYNTRIKKEVVVTNPLINILDKIDIPYFESITEDSVDFLINLGLDANNIWKPLSTTNYYARPEWCFSPMVIGFNRKRIVTSTLKYCYCIEGIIDVIGELNPKFLINSKLEE